MVATKSLKNSSKNQSTIFNQSGDKTMKLTYRGNQYIPSHQVEAPKTVQLIYRGVTIDRTFNPVHPTILENAKPIQLIYRGVSYTRPATPAPSYQEPRAINWRYRIA
jgi:hypothetical protein